MNRVDFLDLGYHTTKYQKEFEQIFRNVLTKGQFILGNEVAQFETEFKEFIGTNHVLGVGNGLDALVMALKALKVGPGDEVIVPAHTFIATWLAVSAVGATLVPVDVESTTMNIDVDLVKSAVTKKTRAVIGVHLYGRPCNAIELAQLCREQNIFFIEDAAQAHGAKIGGLCAGSLGDIACFSFYPGKNLGAFGDGGAVSTNNPELAKKVSLLRNYGSDKKYHHDSIGGNSRLDELQAALLRFKLKNLKEENQHRNTIATFFHRELSGIEELRLPETLQEGLHVWHLYTIRTKQRDQLQTYLKENGVHTHIHYPIPPHLSLCYADLGLKSGDFPVTEDICTSVLSLPMGPHLSLENAKYVTTTIHKYFGI